MLHVTRRFGGTPREYPVYTAEEAGEKGLAYVHWTEAKVGDWCLSDDGFVVKCFRIYEMSHSQEATTNRADLQRILTVGQPFCGYRVDGGERRIVGEPVYMVAPYLKKGVKINASAPVHWAEKVFNRPTTAMAYRVVASMIFARMKGAFEASDPDPSPRRMLSDADFEALGALLFPSHEIPRASVKRWFRTDHVQEKVSMELVKLLEEEGITRQRVVQMYNETYDEAKKVGQTGTMKQVADVYRKMLSMDPDRVRSSQVVAYEEIDFSDEPPSELGDGSEIVLPEPDSAASEEDPHADA